MSTTALSSRTKLREASLSDTELLASIHISSWKNSYQNMLPASYLENDVDHDLLNYWQKKMAKHTQLKESDSRRIIMIAETTDDQVVGFFAGEWNPTCKRGAYLDHIHTLPQYQGSGAGRFMMDTFQQWAKQMGASQTYLLVLEQNVKAIQFYERRGWLFEESLRTFPTEGIAVPTRLYTLTLL